MRLPLLLNGLLLLTLVAGSDPLNTMIPKKFLDKAKSTLHGARQAYHQPPKDTSGDRATHSTPRAADINTAQVPPASAQDILKYRYHHGTNLGSVFVLEKWLTPSMYPNSSTSATELAAVKASVQEIGMDATKAKWEAHWRDWVTTSDIQWLVHSGHGKFS
jgi:hypothetical protein